MPTLLDLAYDGAYIGRHLFVELWRWEGEVYMVTMSGQVYVAPTKLVYDVSFSAA